MLFSQKPIHLLEYKFFQRVRINFHERRNHHFVHDDVYLFPCPVKSSPFTFYVLKPFSKNCCKRSCKMHRPQQVPVGCLYIPDVIRSESKIRFFRAGNATKWTASGLSLMPRPNSFISFRKEIFFTASFIFLKKSILSIANTEQKE